jgi:hypothetical protein
MAAVTTARLTMVKNSTLPCSALANEVQCFDPEYFFSRHNKRPDHLNDRVFWEFGADERT